MVLEVSPVGETDRRVVLLTKERGKISAFARGARKQGSRLMAATNPFCFGEFILYEGRNSYSLSEAVIRNYFEDMRMHFEEACYGMYFLELMDYYTRENNDEREMLLLLYQSLRALLHAAYDNRLVRYIFEIKAVVLNGEYPGLPKNKDYEESSRYALQYIADSSVEKLYSFKVSDEVLQELAIGEALVSVLNEEGIPTVVKRCTMLPPQSNLGTLDDRTREEQIRGSMLYSKYNDYFDRDSAYEFLQRMNLQAQKEAEEAAAQAAAQKEEAARQKEQEKLEAAQLKAQEREQLRLQKEQEKEALRIQKAKEKEEEAKKKKANRVAGSVARSAAGTVGRELGNSLGKSIGGSFGKRLGGNVGASLGRGIMSTLFKL